MSTELDLRHGWVEEELAAEFPELGLMHATLPFARWRSTRAVRERLKAMSDRFTGPKAVQVRQQPVPWAYRVFFRQIGIDPDYRRTPVEAAALERMRAGAFQSSNLLDDAIMIATVETGVPLLAYDARRVGGELGLRLAQPGERLGGDGRTLRGGEVVVGDSSCALGVLFGDIGPRRGVHTDTDHVLLAAVQVKGVPDVCVEEALWIAAETLAEDD